MDNYRFLLGAKIKFLRQEKHITQEVLAELVNRSKNHISKIEQGVANPPLSLLLDIANVLNVHPFELFNFDISLTNPKNVNVKKELYAIKNKKILKLIYKIYKVLISENI